MTVAAAVIVTVYVTVTVQVTTNMTMNVFVTVTVIPILPAGDSVNGWSGSPAASFCAAQPGTAGCLPTCHHRQGMLCRQLLPHRS